MSIRSVVVAGSVLAVTLATIGPATADPGIGSGSASGTTLTPKVAAAGARGVKGPLSPRLSEIAAAKPRSTDALASAAEAAGLPRSGAGALMLGPGVSVEVSIRVNNVSAEVRQALTAAGAQITVASSDTSSYSAYVAPENLTAVVAVAGVLAVSEILKPRLSVADVPARAPKPAAAVGPLATCSPTTSLADTQLQAALARTNFGVDGTGIKIGVLSDSYNLNEGALTWAGDDVATGNLPGPGNPCGRTTPVQVIADNMPPSTATDEGRGMLQLVHKVAPGATLMFATAFVGGQPGFADNIRALRAAGADIIVDDVSYFNESMFQEGIVAKAVTDVTASGATYLSSAANNNSIVGGNNISSVELSDFQPAPASPTSCPAVVDTLEGSGTPCQDFAPAPPAAPENAAQYTVAAGASVLFNLQYSEPLYGVTDDLDLFLLNDGGTTILDSGFADNIANGTPFESVSYFNSTAAPVNVRLAIARFSGTGTPRTKIVGNSSLAGAEYTTSSGRSTVGPTIFGHNGGVDTLSIAAVDGSSAGTTPETFSSRGPVTQYWGPFTDTLSPAAATPPVVLAKPDFTATDGDCTTFFGEPFGPFPCPWKFFGTSAAAPNAAGVAALMLSRNNTLTPAQVKAKLIASAAAMSGGSAGSTGAGLLDANAALALVSLAAPTVTSISPTSGPIAGGTAVTITGTGLTGATALTLGGSAGTAVTAVSATTVTAVTPVNSAGAKDVVVTTPGGVGTLTGGYTYVGSAPPPPTPPAPVVAAPPLPSQAKPSGVKERRRIKAGGKFKLLTSHPTCQSGANAIASLSKVRNNPPQAALNTNKNRSVWFIAKKKATMKVTITCAVGNGYATTQWDFTVRIW